MENKKRALGKGLEQLFDLENLNVENVSDFEKSIYEETPGEEIVELNVDEITYKLRNLLLTTTSFN